MTDFTTIRSLKIEKLGFDLRGKGFLGNKEYFFRYVNPGDIVTFESRGRGKRRYEKVEQIERSLPFSPICSVYGDCGGCAGQHIPYQEQFQLKTDELISTFQDSFGLRLKSIPASRSYHYRNRMDFAVHPGLTGLHQAENFRKIIDIKTCHIQSEEANQELKLFRNWIANHPEFPYNRKSEEGFLKYITIRKGRDLVAILTFIEDFKEHSMLDQIASEYASVSRADNIVFCFNRKKSEVSADGSFRVIKGDAFFRQVVAGKTITVPFHSFFQPNPEEFTHIIQFIEFYLNEIQDLFSHSLLDLFCGSGFFSLLLGNRFNTVTGFDSVPSAINTAKESFMKMYPHMIPDFRVADLFQEKVCKEVLNGLEQSVMIVDPPRAGLGEKLSRFMNEYGGKYFFYVSCNPWNQKKDLEILLENYEIIDGLIADPYPQTPHLESVVFLKKKI